MSDLGQWKDIPPGKPLELPVDPFAEQLANWIIDKVKPEDHVEDMEGYLNRRLLFLWQHAHAHLFPYSVSGNNLSTKTLPPYPSPTLLSNAMQKVAEKIAEPRSYYLDYQRMVEQEAEVSRMITAIRDRHPGVLPVMKVGGLGFLLTILHQILQGQGWQWSMFRWLFKRLIGNRVYPDAFRVEGNPGGAGV